MANVMVVEMILRLPLNCPSGLLSSLYVCVNMNIRMNIHD